MDNAHFFIANVEARVEFSALEFWKTIILAFLGFAFSLQGPVVRKPINLIQD